MKASQAKPPAYEEYTNAALVESHVSPEVLQKMQEQIIPGDKIRMDEKKIDQAAYTKCKANREVNYTLGVEPAVIDRTLKPEPLAIVGYGPSLNQTWPRLQGWKGPIWSTSKAHDFLIQRGIIPTRHLDLDPGTHKAEFMTKPRKDIEYWLSTHAHPDYVRKMIAAEVPLKMFHVMIDPKDKVTHNFPGFEAQFDVGLQACEIGYKEGYRDQHWFGIEYGCPEKQSHAGDHWGPGAKAPQIRISVKGEIHWTNVMFLHGLLLAEDFLCHRALVKPTIHGDTLLGRFLMARGRTPRVKCQV